MRRREREFMPLGAFGKLPLARGWIEARTGTPEGTLVKDWFLAGRQVLLERTEENGAGEEEDVPRVLERRGRYFVLQARNVPDLVVGLVAPSRDAARPNRSAPFALFLPLPRRPYEKRYGLLPMLLRDTWDLLEDAWDAVTGCPTEEALLEEIRGWRLPLPSPRAGVEDAYGQKLQERADDLVRSMEHPWQEFLASRLRDVARALGQGFFREPTVIVELPPVATLEDAAFATSFWMEVIHRQVSRWRRSWPSVFLPRFRVDQGGDRSPVLVFGKLDAPAYGAVLGAGAGAGVHRLHRPGGPGSPGSAMGTEEVPSYRELVRPW